MFDQTKATENMLSSARKQITEHLASDRAGRLEKLELCCSAGGGSLEELELLRSWRHIRCSRTLGNVRPNQSARTHVIKHPKTCYQAPGVRHGRNSGGAGALEELKLRRSWSSGEAGILEELEFLRSQSSAGIEVLAGVELWWSRSSGGV